MSSQEVLEGDPEGSVSMLAYALGTMGPTIVEQQGCSDADDSHRVVFVDLTFCPELGNKRLFFCSEERTVETHPERAARAKGQRRGRFDACQWMAMQELKEGLVYWDVITAHSSGWAAGVAYSSLTHRERLGRTSSSWCLEWSSGQLRAWHNNVNTDVKHSVPSGVRVILDMTKGYLWFQSLDQHQTELHRFHVNFSGPLKPMFWLHGLSENALKFPKP
ncbi:hypothetical protein DNTS_034964 [Danionella cerebrum]|nr:hypothetical protein DNTS_034964 [Danionella translucida]